MDKQYKVESYYYNLNEITESTDLSTAEIDGHSITNNIIQPVNNQLKKIVDLSIQAYPGSQFVINNNNDNPIIIGPSGIFQWKILNNEGYIYSIQFKKLPFKMSIQQINMIVTYGYYLE